MLLSQTNLAWDTLFQLEAAGGSGPFHVRLTNAIREAIRSGRAPSGSALPPSRKLSADLGCSRWAVTEAYEQLTAEGYLEPRVGSATRVRIRDQGRSAPSPPIMETREPPRFDLRPGWADLQAFPRTAWVRAMREVVATMPTRELWYPPRGGHLRLRVVIAEYLCRVRGAAVRPEAVTITTGILDGMMQLGRALFAVGHKSIAVEHPCWNRLYKGVTGTGLQLVPVPVDADGMQTGDLLATAARAAIVTPAHQFPTGAVLSPSRRTALLKWADSVDGLVFEDDYDAEFRYDRRPVGALQGVSPDRVALFGSLSKTLAPAIGLGWMVTPPRWTDAIRSAETRMTGPSTIEQLTMARFIESGAYDRHLRGQRRKYRLRRDRLATALARRLPMCKVSGAAAGMHFLVTLPAGVEAASVVAAAASRGLRLLDLRACRPGADNRDSRDSLPSNRREGLVIGYGNLNDTVVERAIAELEVAICEAGRL